MKISYALVILLCLAPMTSFAEATYYSDPVYAPLTDSSQHPLQSMVTLADKKDNARAQFILGDLHSKGKGGFKQDIKVAYKWFERSAEKNYFHSFIRLAALEKKKDNALESYKWYSLALKHPDNTKDTKAFILEKRTELVEEYALEKADFKKAKKEIKIWKKEQKKNAQLSSAAKEAKKIAAKVKEKEKAQEKADNSKKEVKSPPKNETKNANHSHQYLRRGSYND